MRIAPFLFPLLFLFTLLVGLTFLVRILLGPFSPRIFEQIRKHPILHAAWGFLAVSGFYFFFVLIPCGPPDWVDRIGQRKTLGERVRAAGGWEAVRRDCALLVSNKTDRFYWQPSCTNVQATTFSNEIAIHYVTNIDYGPLPPALEALKSREIRCHFPIMHIRLFGIHSTGGHSIPYSGLEVVCNSNADGYRPQKGKTGGVDGNSHSRYRRVSEGIFEVY
jgi:hypothetical protein